MKKLVIKFLTDTISDEELELLKKWLQKPKNQRFFKEMIETDQRLDFAYRPIDVEKAYRRIVEAAHKTKGTQSKNYRSIFKYAALVMALIATSFGVYYYLHTQDSSDKAITPQTNGESKVTLELNDGTLKVLDEHQRSTIATGNDDAVVRHEYNKLTYQNSATSEIEQVYNRLHVPYGKRFNVTLSDGTVVHLNSGTQLRYPEVFDEEHSRDVYLKGEAFFSVTENAGQPFIVHTEKMNVRVFGTKFNVSSYENEEITSAVLVEGSVGVYGATQTKGEDEILISPSQQAVMQNGAFSVHDVDVQKFIAWIDGTLYFDNDRFGDIVKELERYYNVKIVNNHQELDDVRYTGTFRSTTLRQILNVFRRNTEFEYSLKNKEIVISPSF